MLKNKQLETILESLNLYILENTLKEYEDICH